MITKAQLEDVTALNKLVNSAYRGESSKKGWTSEADLLGGIRTNEEGINELINKPDTTILKYTENNEVLGCMMLEKQGNSLYLGMLTVSPDLQGKGIGKEFLAAAEVFATENQIEKIVMTVISIRAELIAWYERHGYVKTGETKPFPMNDPNFGIPKQPLEFIVLDKIV
ncbi:ribosomal protein S18 acetylase RimI-like enzyme [Arcicella aurantiaca]|uniref:Ribosomal protein S18 acetylase RimI-like enzyme n=1 Tax=Arcicella aurantiaca TaxID=591202 RepID=A0A316F199_9BACT|nr:GNAT family N-acetyltransferase [Arcicella aurantiaca]PWK29399.1 ribosomal protein S18 acetylase RimI-like enzyme [Arcicella aurantiaca]